VVLVVSLIGTASAFALNAGAERRVPRISIRHRVVTTTMAGTTTSTSTTSTSTTVITTTTIPTPTTVAPPTTTPPRAAVVAPTVPPTPAPTVCASALPARLATTSGAGQVITVDAAGYGLTSATLTAWQLSGSCWTVAYGPWTARLGYSGLSTDKHEGDGSTPAGIYGFQATMYGNAPNPGVHYPYRQLVCGDWWDEDSSSPTYNTFQEVPCSETDPPFNNGSSEALWTETQAYPSFAVVNYNAARVPGLGSAIFLHADIGGPTDGCVSLPLGELDPVLDWLQPAENPVIVMGTNSTITSY
jgi:L,D-peptidoglycan transpeptidase YkuD (ErfK/YbiS/YcfS/YnhG family)